MKYDVCPHCGANLQPESDQKMKKLFDQFWECYPKKVQKPAAYKAFSKLQPNEELLTKMETSINTWEKSGLWKNPLYIPYPATWINNHMFDDSPALPEAAQKSVWDEVKDL